MKKAMNSSGIRTPELGSEVRRDNHDVIKDYYIWKQLKIYYLKFIFNENFFKHNLIVIM